MSALYLKKYVVNLFDFKMFGMKNDNYLAWSPDAVALLELKWLEERGHNMDRALGGSGRVG